MTIPRDIQRILDRSPLANEPLRSSLADRDHYAKPLLPAVYVHGSPEREWLIAEMAERLPYATAEECRAAAEVAIDAQCDLGCTLTLGTRECADCGAEVSAHLFANGSCWLCQNAALSPDKDDE